MSRKRFFVGLALLLFRVDSFSCGPYLPFSYLMDGEEYMVLMMPRGELDSDLEVILGPKQSNGASEKTTLEADVEDLRTALTESGADYDFIENTTRRYRGLRQAIEKHFAGEKNGTFDLPLYQDILDLLPEEFSVYLRGAVYYKNDEYDAAVKEWTSLLELPSDKRRYKSVWAAYMIGRALISTDNDRSIAAFRETRELADKGYPDSLGLVAESLGWEAFLAAKEGDIAGAVLLYCEFYREVSAEQVWIAVNSIRMVCHEAVSEDGKFDERFVTDEKLRQILAAHVIYYYDGGPVSSPGKYDGWLKALAKADAPIHGKQAEQLAWAAYSLGDIENARGWLGLADQKSAYGRWIESKILLREGKIGEAIEILQSIKNRFPICEDPWTDAEMDYPYRVDEQSASGNIVYAEIGTLELGRSDYVAALDAFLRAQSWSDAAYIAERVLTTDEVEEYLRRHAMEQGLFGVDNLRHLLSRRFARNGDWKKAGTYIPEEYKEILDSYFSNLSVGENHLNGNEKRGEGFFKAGILAREHGIEILATELEPDWAMHEGTYTRPWSGATRLRSHDSVTVDDDLYENRYKRMYDDMPADVKAALSAGEDEKRRVVGVAPQPDRRFHYRWRASELMWEAAELLPDNDVLAAKALYYGGSWIKNEDPEGADKFYKALVNRCRKLEIAQEADRRRWFPEAPERW